MTDRLVLVLLGIIAIAATAIGIAGAVVMVFVLLSCGEMPAGLGPFAAAGLLVASGSVPATPAGGCIVSTDGARWTVIGMVVLLTIVAALCLAGWLSFRESDRWFRSQLLRRNGLAGRSEVRRQVSERALLRRAGTLRPTLADPAADDVGWRIGTSRGLDVYVSIEDSLLLDGPPRSGKGWRVIISAILDWNGPLVTTSTRNDNLAATMAHRAQRGTVTVFDPQQLSGVRSALRISPVTGCADPLVAEQRARTIIAGSALGRSSTNQEWAGASGTLLAALLHAAALSGGGTTALRDWGMSPVLAGRAVDVLADSGAPGWAMGLADVIEGDAKLLGSKWFGVAEALRPLAIPSVFDAMNPALDEALDVNEFLAASNTIYLIGTGTGAGAVGGFLGAVLDDIVETARRKALASPGNRLDPPLGLILDEIANMFAWPQLPTILSDGGGIGISTMVVLQSLSQAKSRWSESEADTIWNSAIAKLMLGGSSNIKHLQDVSSMLGQRQVNRGSVSRSETGTTRSEQRQLEPVLTVDELRRLPEGMGLLSYRNRRGVLLDVEGWTTRRDAREIVAGKRSTEAAQRQVFTEQSEARRKTHG
ncbi:type IV secretory system conjugative DNA transfer family protein [Plantibacter sp. MMLR14_011]|uniref:type IV secretory system conjugative DNA transfer family protein n=1 Tax=Plantibacter sp. MMLR14_011 TaxID=1898746 RepID=UPI0008DCD63E|nr:type IV secretory system conjugative DNA transfer family protein [Plantibacter sp. MMLR14_011]OII39286.1 hypothetical protein BIU99_07850 [Plantibacter sp. MMLR14_011]